MISSNSAGSSLLRLSTPPSDQASAYASTLVLGIGNTLFGDEGVGVWVIERLQRRAASELPRLQLLDGGTLSFSLAPILEDSEQLIVVDAAELQQAPGSVQVFSGAAMDEFSRRACNSVHEVGLSDLLDIMRLTERLPARRALVGIQPLFVDWSTEPSESVARAIPVAVQCVLDLATGWQGGAAVSALVETAE